MRAIVQPAAVRSLGNLPNKDRAALLQKIERFAADPFSPNPSAKPLRGHPQVVRIRQGDWRAVCRIDRANDVVIVEAIGNRREIYR
jgi:mRNA interferase RelE/StbE